MAKHNLDIFELLRKVDSKDYDYYSELSSEKKKGFTGVVALKWLSCAPEPYSDYYLIATNTIANQYFFDIAEHPELQYKLLAATGCGQRTKHGWISNNKKGSSASLIGFMEKYYASANISEIKIILSKYTEETFSDFVDGTGIDKTESKKIKKAFKLYK